MAAETRTVLTEVAQTMSELEMLGTPEGERAATVMYESFDRLMGILRREDRGWVPVFTSQPQDSEFGLTLQDLKDWDRKITESQAGAPWIGRGFRLRNNNIWEKGIHYSGIGEQGGSGVNNLTRFISTPQNQRHFFGKQARTMREKRLYTSSIAFWIGNNETKQLEAVPLRQIYGQILHPDGIGVVWAYLREWTRYDHKSGKSREMKMWYLTEDADFDGPIGNIQNPNTGETIPVSRTHTIFAQHANPIEGLVYGVPDALAAFIHHKFARDAYMDGVSVTDALARFALKATAKTKAAAQNAAMQYANAQTAGSMAVVGGANDIEVLSSAGKGYDFSSLRPLVAVIATALDVGTTALTADSADEGSYASSVTLDRPTRLAMQDRREEHVAFDEQILRWMGAKEPVVQFKPYDAGEEVYRIIQGFSLAHHDNAYTTQEYRDFVDNLLGLPAGKVPTGDDRPFGDLAAKPAADGASGGKQAASPNQGKSNGTGGQKGGSASNDLRSDTVSK